MMTLFELCDLEDGWKEVRKVHEQFYKGIMAIQLISANGAFVKEL
jgi:hypothetical protein